MTKIFIAQKGIAQHFATMTSALKSGGGRWSFKEKPQVKEGWINGGFFVVNKKFLRYIKNDNTILEKEPLEKAVTKKQLCAFKHSGFWKCMDVKRDRDELIEIYKKNKFFSKI